MSDKIAIMNDGQIEQVGTPSEVYREPKNVFVSQFIGSPEVNLLDASVVDVNEKETTVDIDGGPQLTFETGEYLQQHESDDVILGFRPRKAEAYPATSSTPGIETTVSLHEPLGDEVLMYLDGPQGELRVVVPFGDEIDEGDSATIVPQVASIYLFNAKTGERFARGNLSSEALATVVEAPTASD